MVDGLEESARAEDENHAFNAATNSSARSYRASRVAKRSASIPASSIKSSTCASVEAAHVTHPSAASKTRYVGLHPAKLLPSRRISVPVYE
jgi:hypothetical protein